MATPNRTGPAPTPSGPLVGFRSDFEAYFVGGEHEPALVINPAASMVSLLAAAESRVRRLEKQLSLLTEGGWDVEAVKLEEVCGPLWALAQEASMLLERISAKKENGNG